MFSAINISRQLVKYKCKFKNWRCSSTYEQGQSPEPKIREYFYYIDHQGMLFLDDARMKNFTSCFKEKKFLRFFFAQLRLNNTDRYTDFPYLSLCGKERNYLRCDDYPFVFTHILQKGSDSLSKTDCLAYNHAGELLSLPLEPEKIFMLPATGRVYHPAPERVGSIGLVRSKLAIELSKYFEFENGELDPPTIFKWGGTAYKLDNLWYQEAVKNNPVLCRSY